MHFQTMRRIVATCQFYKHRRPADLSVKRSCLLDRYIGYVYFLCLSQTFVQLAAQQIKLHELNIYLSSEEKGMC